MAVLPTDYQDATTPTGALTELPATTTRGINAITGQINQNTSDLASLAPIHAASSKTPPVDADELPLSDSAASFGLKKLTWANLKAAIKSYYDAVASTLTNKDLTSGTNTFPTFNQNTTGSAAKLTTARTINGVSFDGTANITTERTWAPEAIISTAALAVGYNDLPGGFSVEPGPGAAGVLLDAIWIRLGTIGATVATTNAVFDIYGGTATTQGTLITSVTVAVGANNQIATLGSAYALAANSVVRVYCSTAGGVSTPIHCQLRGRYA